MSKAPRRAAGGVIVRQTASGRTEVLLVHRPHRQDWTFPKGKVEAGETDAECALREVEEETGLQCVLVDELPTISYVDQKDRLKVARYWLMRPVSGRATPQNEIDAVRWLPVAAAARTLTYERDLALLDALSAVAAR
jgi:8-oxo-dGTP pyrophosphatase MutT (NUDIX family)